MEVYLNNFFINNLKLLQNEKENFIGRIRLALLATAGFGVNKSMSNKAQLSDLALANVEALADSESGGGEVLWSREDEDCAYYIT